MDIVDLVSSGVVRVVDIEGDGNNPPSPVEISFVTLDSGRVASVDTWLVDPGRPINPYVAQMTGLGDAEVAGRPAFSSIEDEVRALLSGAVVVGHDVRQDLLMLSTVMADAWELPSAVYDTLRLAKNLLSLPRNRLDAVAEHLEVPFDTDEGRGRAHSAERDALVCARVLGKLAALVPDRARQRAHIDRSVRVQPPRKREPEHGPEGSMEP